MSFYLLFAEDQQGHIHHIKGIQINTDSLACTLLWHDITLDEVIYGVGTNNYFISEMNYFKEHGDNK